MKTINTTIEPYYRKIGFVEYYEEPKIVQNNWIFTTINDCIAYIEVLNLSGGAGDIVADLRNEGYKVSVIGLDIYVTQ